MNVGQSIKEEKSPLVKKFPHIYAREEFSAIFLICLAILTIFLVFDHG